MTRTPEVTTMTSDQNPHTARQAPGLPHEWEVSWLPGHILDRNSAITAMVLADIARSGDLRAGHGLWPPIQSWAAELALTGPDAIAASSQPPRGLGPGHERGSGHPDGEGGRLTSQQDITSRSPGSTGRLPSAGPARWTSDSLIHIGGIGKLFTLGRTAAYELTHRPDFPEPVPISSRCHRWWASEIDAFADNLRRQRPDQSGRDGGTQRASKPQTPHLCMTPPRVTGKVRTVRVRGEAS
jgi:predicted DNA-binding transcriptional regulator AlpA